VVDPLSTSSVLLPPIWVDLFNTRREMDRGNRSLRATRTPTAPLLAGGPRPRRVYCCHSPRLRGV